MLAGPTPPASATTLAVSAVAIQSTPAGNTQYYTGEDIIIRVTFGAETITAHTGATIAIDIGGVSRTATAADVASGGANAYVDFTYKVTDSDRDTDGITVAAGTLGGSYTHTDPHTSVPFTQTVAADTAHRVNVDVTNYDSDGDGLIEIENLDQLNAIRYDLNGDGQPTTANISNYAAAFPGRSQSHGCPDTADADNDPGPCIGYELDADLDFDTDGNGSVGAGDDYPNWTPIGEYSNPYTNNAVFNGNGHTISNLTINASNLGGVGLFGSVGSNNHVGGTIENVGLLDVNITASFARTGGQAFMDVGGLVGAFRGTARTNYATGTITVSSVTGNLTTEAGGLIGFLGHVGAGAAYATRLDACWSDVNVSITSSSTAGTTGGAQDSAGGLVGVMAGTSTSPSTLTTSYARDVTVASTRTGSAVGGLLGRATGITTISTSHWDTTNQATSGGGSGVVGKTTTELKSPTDYGASAGDTFYGWNINLDGQPGNDDPWNFGTSSQYPVLKYGGHQLIAQGRDLTVDYDADDDGLIEIKTLAQLDAVRYDLDGNGAPTNANAYNSAFPSRDASPAGRMGCELTDHDNTMATPDRATCTGYELLTNLDFDTDGDGATYTTSAMGVVAVDADDTNNYFNGAAGWTPLGGHGADAVPFTATFEGNHHTISNLFINLDTAGDHTGKYVGLFANLGKPATTSPAAPAEPGAVRNVGLVNPYVSNERDGAHATLLNYVRTGALAGGSTSAGAVSGSYVSGGSVTGTQNAVATGTVFNFAGCLLGFNDGAVTGSNASCAATATGADDASDYAGGLMGWNEGAVTGSYATGTATADSRAGGLAAELTVGGTVIASYATGAVSVTGDGGVAGGLVASMSSASTAVRASYATGAVSTSGGGTNNLGGLAGQISGTAPVIVASYSTGTATASGTGVGVTNNAGGLVGALVSSATVSQITNSYWDVTTTSIADPPAGQATSPGAGQTTSALIGPTEYGTTGIYTGWNLNLDGQSGNDDPWHFGDNMDYPLLKYGHDALSVALQIGAAPVDYDADNDNLIEISALAQLDAVRYDLDGNGLGVVGDDAVAYAAAFPGLPKGMGCPALCQGYELTADLDFDTDGDGSTYAISSGTVTADADDTNNFFNGNAGWTSIGDDTTGYSGVFEGNRHTIDNLFIHVSVDSTATRARVGLFSRLEGEGVIRGVGLTDAYVRRQTSSGGRYAGALVGNSYGSITASHATGEVVVADTAGSGTSRAGGLVGAIGTGGAISASYADVTVRMTGNNGRAGGLTGYSYGGKITASHAMGDVIIVNSAGTLVGGLVGEILDNTNRTPDVLATIDASYARGAISGNTGTFTGRVLAGLVASSSAAARVTNSYYDNTSAGTGLTASAGGGMAKSTAELQSITGYTGIYENWNVNVDGATGNDDPWHFGTASQYPTLKYGGFSPAAQGSSGTDYDTNSNGLIEITELAQLDAIRLDLDGDGRPTSILAYLAAFPVADVGTDAEMGTAGRMGCAYDHDDDPITSPAQACIGYELMDNLDFDTNDSGATHTNGVGDPGDDYYNGGVGWNPIGGHDANAQPYTAILDGNDNDIENLFINLDTSADNDGRFVALFANISSAGAVRNLGLVNPYVKNARSGGGRFIYYGALAGNSDGAVSRVSVRGGQVAGGQTNAISNNNNYVGCLLGRSQGGTVSDSYATCAATVAGGGRGVVGGLVGYNRGGTVLRSYAEGAVSSDYQAGGLVGFSGRSTGRISDSYATGAVSSSGHGEAGGLVGFNNAGADIVDSYATGAVSSSGNGSGATNTADAGGLVGEMTSPGSTLTGSYAAGAVSTTGNYNAVGGLVGFVENGATVAGSYATGAVRVTAAASSNNSLGGLVGRLTGNTSTGLSGSYATGAVSGNGGGTNNLGGLVGLINRNNPHIRAAYATGAVSASGSGTNRLGGLVGYADTSASNYPRIAASYAAGAVSASGSGSNTLGGLVGGVATIGRPVFTNVYWDSEATGQTTSADLAGDTAQTTAALRNPIGYTSIYLAWNIDVDQTGNANDDPWDFGTDGEYPVLIYGALTATAQGRTLVDYDTDNDGLIDIKTLAQLDAVRYDLDGNGHPASNAPDYRSAYPNRDGSAAGRMGCPLTDNDNDADTPDQATCTGYELRNDLDFDTDRDGSTHTGGTGDMQDDYYNGGNGWSRIGDGSTPYSATFDGKGHTIDNLFMRIRDGQRFGLFGEVSGSGKIASLGVRNAYVANASGTEPQNVGILVGLNNGHIVASYTTGYVRGYDAIGGLVGYLGNVGGGSASITASYSTAAVDSDGAFGIAGGLAGQTRAGSINQSYYAGPRVSGPAADIGGLLGERVGGGTTTVSTDSYWDKTPGGVPNTSPQSPDAAGKTTAELQEPTGYTGSIYANWNVDLDGDNSADDPWDFRFGHYPVLKYGGFDVDEQRPLRAMVGADVQAYSGQPVTVEGSGRASHGATLGASPYRWTVSDPDGLDPATLTLSGAETARLTFTAPTGLTTDKALVFRLTVTGTVGGRTVTVFDEVTVNVVAVRPNQLLSLSLTDSEGDAVGLAPPFVSLRYDYRASVANQIASVTITPGVLSGSTMTLNGQAAASGAAVEVPLKYRGNQITIVVTPPEPDETMNGETADGETADDETEAETPCSVDNDGIKPCTYTVTVTRAVPPRLAFVPRSLTIEEGGTGAYTVALDTRILTGAVTIAIASDNPAVTVSPTEVTLRPLDMAPRTITVTAASDADRNDETAVITHTANGAHYYDVIATVGVKVNDTTAPPPAPDPALSVSATALRLAEGGSGAYTVALATRPADNVTVTIASDNADVTTRPASLAFTTANWSTPQRVTASAAADGDTANDAATLTHTASGGGYNAAPAVSVSVSVTDDDTAGLSITPTVLNLIENGISAYIVSLTAQPSGNVTVAIASDNPDVTVRPAALTFTPSNWATPQAVLVITRADAGGGDELATLRMTAQGGGYTGQTGQVLASVDDKLAPLPARSVTTSPDAPAGVSVYGPPGTTATATVSPPAADTPTVATGAGFGIGKTAAARSVVGVSVSDAPDDGLEICLPVSDGLRAEAGSALILTLLRYAGGSWTELSGARDLGDRVCAAGVMGEAAYATAYALRPGTVLDLAASAPADAPGTIELSWTPPAAGTAQVAVVVNVADDTDYCLDTLPGLAASSYTCAGRTAGATYVALLIVLLPDGGYTLANIVRFDLPAADRQ